MAPVPPNDYVGSKNGLVIETKYICRLLPDDKIFRLLVTRGGAEWRAAPPRHPRGEEYHSWAGHRYHGPSHCWAGLDTATACTNVTKGTQ